MRCVGCGRVAGVTDTQTQGITDPESSNTAKPYMTDSLTGGLFIPDAFKFVRPIMIVAKDVTLI